jgi:ribonuclease HI
MALVIYTDGGSRNNPGPAGIGVVAYRGDEQLFTLSEFLGVQTNNWAEYQGVIRALETVLERKREQALTFGVDTFKTTFKKYVEDRYEEFKKGFNQKTLFPTR